MVSLLPGLSTGIASFNLSGSPPTTNYRKMNTKKLKYILNDSILYKNSKSSSATLMKYIHGVIMKNATDITTDILLSRLFRTTSIKRFLKYYDEELKNEPFHEYLESLCNEKNMNPSAVVRAANIERTYGLQIFRGIKNPSRDKVAQLAFGFSLNIEETQKLLKAANKSMLYPKIKRDAVIIYCIKNSMNVMDAQEILSDLQLPLLGGETV